MVHECAQIVVFSEVWLSDVIWSGRLVYLLMFYINEIMWCLVLIPLVLLEKIVYNILDAKYWQIFNLGPLRDIFFYYDISNHTIKIQKMHVIIIYKK